MTMNKIFWAHLLRAGLKFSFDLGLSLSALFRPKFISFTEVLLSWVTGTKDMSSAVCLKSDSHLPKKYLCYLFEWKPFKNDEKCFLFHLKSSFRSQDI